MTKRFSQGRLLCLTNNADIVSPPSSLVHQRSGHILRSDIRCQLYKTSFRLQSNQTAVKLCSLCKCEGCDVDVIPPFDHYKHEKYKYLFVVSSNSTPTENWGDNPVVDQISGWPDHFLWLHYLSLWCVCQYLSVVRWEVKSYKLRKPEQLKSCLTRWVIIRHYLYISSLSSQHITGTGSPSQQTPITAGLGWGSLSYCSQIS